MNKLKMTKEDLVVNTIAIVLGLFVLIITLYPFYLCLLRSFNEGQDAATGNLFFLPRKFTLMNYYIVLSDNALIRSFAVTILRTVIGTLSGLFFTSMVSYGLSKKNLLFRRGYSYMALITMYFSGGLIPGYLLLRNLHLLNNFLVYIIPGLFSYYYALLIIAFYRELPDEIEESAKIDGAGDFYIFVRIIFPLSKPVLATIALFLGVNHWNDWFTSAYYISDQKLWTMPTILMRVLSGVEGLNKINEMKGSVSGMNMGTLNSSSSVTLESIRYATLVVTVLPIILVYPFLQKYFVKGMLVGSIKA